MIMQAHFHRHISSAFLRNDLTDFEDECERYRNVTRERICEAAKSLVLDTVYVMEANDGQNN